MELLIAELAGKKNGRRENGSTDEAEVEGELRGRSDSQSRYEHRVERIGEVRATGGRQAGYCYYNVVRT